MSELQYCSMSACRGVPFRKARSRRVHHADGVDDAPPGPMYTAAAMTDVLPKLTGEAKKRRLPDPKMSRVRRSAVDRG